MIQIKDVVLVKDILINERVGPLTLIKSGYIYLRTGMYKNNKLSNFIIHGKTILYLGKNIRIINKGRFLFGIGKIGTAFISKDKPILDMEENSTLIINGSFAIGPGSCVSISKNATVELGNNSYITANSKIMCQDHVKIGDNCAISWDVEIMDSDFHNINGHSRRKPIDIGDHVLICCRATILKGVKIGNGAIVASGAVVTKDVPENCLVGGVPAKVIEENVSWSL